MRHRGQDDRPTEDTTATLDARPDPLAALRADLAARALAAQRRPGSPRVLGAAGAAGAMPLIPAQSRPGHDAMPPEPPIDPIAEPDVDAVSVPVEDPRPAHAPDVPETARWRASHLPRVLAAVLLGLAVLGTSGLGLRYAQARSTDNFVSLVIGTVVVVVLWALLIASTPQVVTLQGSVLTIHNSGGRERFDLAEALQPVDLVGDPRSRSWALLLHRANRTSLVLRRHDVVATELDPIVRHYREIALRRYAEREARFGC